MVLRDWSRALLLSLVAFCFAVPAVHAAPLSDEELAERVGDGDPAAGEQKAKACQSCHGALGNSSAPTVPKLASQFAGYQLKQFRNFQFAQRKHYDGAADKAVSSGDLADIAAYFALQDLSAGAGAPDAAAERLFAAGDAARLIPPCQSCHGPVGRGLAAGSDANPSIGSQHRDYLRQQLLAWRSGARSGSTAMTLATKPLSDAEIDALAGYLAGLQ